MPLPLPTRDAGDRYLRTWDAGLLFLIGNIWPHAPRSLYECSRSGTSVRQRHAATRYVPNWEHWVIVRRSSDEPTNQRAIPGILGDGWSSIQTTAVSVVAAATPGSGPPTHPTPLPPHPT